MSEKPYTQLTLGWKLIEGKYFIQIAAMRDDEDEWDEYVLLRPFDDLAVVKRELNDLADEMAKGEGLTKVSVL